MKRLTNGVSQPCFGPSPSMRRPVDVKAHFCFSSFLRSVPVQLSHPCREFVAYLDAIGEIDGLRCLVDWKTTASRYPEGPDGLLSLDPQLICYSWISGISEVALVVFVRKHAPEIQYLRASISEEQRQEFGRLVETTINQVEAGHFNPHSGIRFPQNGCVSCCRRAVFVLGKIDEILSWEHTQEREKDARFV